MAGSEKDKMFLLRNYDLWCQLSPEEIAELNIENHFLRIPKGEYVYFEAHHLNKVYFLKEGYIRIGWIDTDGTERVREIIQQGELFGQLTLEKHNLRGEFAQAYRQDVSVCAFRVEDFEKLLRKRPDLALKYSRQVGNKLRTIETRLQTLLNKDVRTRLEHFFWQLIEQEMGEDRPEGFCIPNYLTHEDIANLIGASRQTVTTMINELGEEGIVSYDRQQICFLNVKKLRNRVNVD